MLERTLATYAGPGTARGRAAGARCVAPGGAALRAGRSAVGPARRCGRAAIVVPIALSGGSGVSPIEVAAADAGWRWETFRGLELQVPAEWGYGTVSQPWCIEGAPTSGYVGRPGPTVMVACEPAEAPADQRVPFVWFGIGAVVDEQPGDGWTYETHHVGSEPFTVMTNDAAVRDHIVDSARVVDSQGDGLDANGCPVFHDIAKDPAYRPAAAAAIEPAEVTAAAICQYTLSMAGTITDGPSLLASVYLEGARASALVAAIRAAPPADDVPTVPEALLLRSAVRLGRRRGPGRQRERGRGDRGAYERLPAGDRRRRNPTPAHRGGRRSCPARRHPQRRRPRPVVTPGMITFTSGFQASRPLQRS